MFEVSARPPRRETSGPPLAGIRVTIALVVLVAAFSGCAGGSPSQVTTPGDRLEGAWIERASGTPSGADCPWVIEVFGDGSLETNRLSDDRGERCMFARVPFELDTGSEPPVLRIGGQLLSCLYERRGDRMWLACDDHAMPSLDAAEWREFEPLAVEPGDRKADLVGDWLPPAFWGGGEPWTIARDGQMFFGRESGRVDVVAPGRAMLRLGDLTQRCRFRATRYRLSLRCVGESEPWPETFYDPSRDAGWRDTLVFYRLQG
jgi:hypothetical protein